MQAALVNKEVFLCHDKKSCCPTTNEGSLRHTWQPAKWTTKGGCLTCGESRSLYQQLMQKLCSKCICAHMMAITSSAFQ